MPRGLYIEQHGNIKRGDVLSFCLLEPYKTIGLNNFYIESGRVCSGAVALIKKVIAIPDDTVILADNSIKINDILYPYKTKHVDSVGRKLALYPRGTYKNIPLLMLYAKQWIA